MSNSHGKSDSSPLLAKVLTAHGGLEIGSECAHCRHTDRDRHRDKRRWPFTKPRRPSSTAGQRNPPGGRDIVAARHFSIMQQLR